MDPNFGSTYQFPDPTPPASTPIRTGSTAYAGFWRRVFAYLIDYFILSAAYVIAAVVLGKNAGQILLLILLLGNWIYYALFESSKFQATPGKMALRIKVTNLNGERIGFGTASGRFFGKLISSITLGIGYLMPAFTARRQALHDKLAGTLVVRASLTASEISSAGPAEPFGVLATALVIIVGVFFGPFGIGVLAAIAIPAYQNYTIRAQVMQGLLLADFYKEQITAALARGQELSSISRESLNPPAAGSPYVREVRVISGVIEVEYGGAANANVQGKTLAIVPGKDSSGAIVWVCGSARPPPGYDIGNTADYTTVPRQYLPQSCHS
jgi:uncharacterized RDD family membrane protein YckC/Tfp pilus assembly major pilin PilA